MNQLEQLSQDAFFAYLESHNCTVMKRTKYDYHKFRNNKSGKVIGVQDLENYFASTICRYCSDLRVPPPPELKELSKIINEYEGTDS